MIATKEAAHTKLCPKKFHNMSDKYCMVDECMCWEWIGGLPPEDDRAQGYCGLSKKRKPGDR